MVLVDEATGKKRWEVQGHAGANSRRHVAMSPNGRFVASVGYDEENWKLWDAANGAEWMTGARHDGTGGCSCTVNTKQEGCPVVAHTTGLRALAFSPCGQLLATGGYHGAVILWNIQTGGGERRMQGPGTRNLPVWSLSFSANGVWLASGSGDQTIRVWDVTTGALLRSIRDVGSFWVAFSPSNSRMLASISSFSTGQMALWDVALGHKIWKREGHGFFAVFYPDGRTIATGALNSDVLLVNAESGEPRLTLGAPPSRWWEQPRRISAASFSVDHGSKLATASADGTCKVWDSSTGALLHKFNSGNCVMSVMWGRDWVRDTQGAMAFAMGHHPRLGVGSPVLELEAGVVRMILDCVLWPGASSTWTADLAWEGGGGSHQ